MIHIGIDPDLQKNGVAIMENGQYKEIISLSFPELLELIFESKNDAGVLFVVEDVNKHKPTFFKKSVRGQGALNKVSQNVGMVKAVGQKIIEMLEFNNVPYELCPPLKGTLKKCKEDAKLFNKLTGWTERTNADKRDAAMMIYKYKK